MQFVFAVEIMFIFYIIYYVKYQPLNRIALDSARQGPQRDTSCENEQGSRRKTL